MEQVSGENAEKKISGISEKVITCPLVGTFYSSPAPDAEDYVKVGDTVKKGQVIGIVEAMKLMNEIESEYDGIVEEILVKNEETVEYGQPLFRIAARAVKDWIEDKNHVRNQRNSGNHSPQTSVSSRGLCGGAGAGRESRRI